MKSSFFTLLLLLQDEKHGPNRPSSVGHISFLSERAMNRSFHSSTFHSDPSPFTSSRKHEPNHDHHSNTHPSSPKCDIQNTTVVFFHPDPSRTRNI
ncbi:hypothetical protein Trydic_g6212 [Trypoxylus dichotomus]